MNKTGAFSALVAAIALLVTMPAEGQPPMIKLDFGPEKSAVMEGFEAVTPKTVYTAARGFGWQPYAVRDHKDPDVDLQQPDPLWADFIMVSGAETRFRIDLPDGQYHLWFWSGRWESDPWSLPPIEGFGLKAADGGEVIHATSLEQYLHENFRLPLTRWLTPDSDFYRDWLAPCFRRFDGCVVAREGRLLLAPWRRFALNGLVICPEQHRAEAELFLAELAEKQRAVMDCTDGTPPVAQGFVPSQEEKRRGLVLLLPQKETLVFPTSTPSDAAPRAEVLTAFACPGETESFTLAVRALNTYEGVRARLTELSGPGRLGGSDVDAYIIQMIPRGASDLSYTYQGHLLRKAEPGTLYANQTAQYWWDVRVPPKASPGVYKGEVVVELDRGREEPAQELARLPVQLRVLNMPLLSSDETGVKLMVPYANFFGYHWRQHWDLYRPVYWQDMRLMKSCGLNTAMLAGDARPIGPTYAQLGTLPLSVIDVPLRRWQICKELGFKQVFWYGFQTLTSISWGSADANRFAKLLGDDYCGPKHRAALREIVETIERMRKERDLPPLIVSIMDEAICHGGEETLPAYTRMIQYFAKLKEEVGIRFCVLDSSYEVDGFVPGLDICAPNRRGNAANFAKMDAVGAERWLYNTGLRRFQMGYYCWRAKLQGMWVWFYCDSRNYQLFPYGTRSSALAYQTPNGPIPTVHAPWVREGIDDLRYLKTLESDIQRGLASKIPRAVAAAKAAKEMLNDLYSRMTDDFSYYVVNSPSGQPAPGAWDPSTLDVIRWKVAQHSVAITEALRERK